MNAQQIALRNELKLTIAYSAERGNFVVKSFNGIIKNVATYLDGETYIVSYTAKLLADRAKRAAKRRRQARQRIECQCPRCLTNVLDADNGNYHCYDSQSDYTITDGVITAVADILPNATPRSRKRVA